MAKTMQCKRVGSSVSLSEAGQRDRSRVGLGPPSVWQHRKQLQVRDSEVRDSEGLRSSSARPNQATRSTRNSAIPTPHPHPRGFSCPVSTFFFLNHPFLGSWAWEGCQLSPATIPFLTHGTQMGREPMDGRPQRESCRTLPFPHSRGLQAAGPSLH